MPDEIDLRPAHAQRGGRALAELIGDAPARDVQQPAFEGTGGPLVFREFFETVMTVSWTTSCASASVSPPLRATP